MTMTMRFHTNIPDCWFVKFYKDDTTVVIIENKNVNIYPFAEHSKNTYKTLATMSSLNDVKKLCDEYSKKCTKKCTKNIQNLTGCYMMSYDTFLNPYCENILLQFHDNEIVKLDDINNKYPYPQSIDKSYIELGDIVTITNSYIFVNDKCVKKEKNMDIDNAHEEFTKNSQIYQKMIQQKS